MSRPSADADAPVRRRHVFYISGFDPKGPAHYHRLYAEQAALAGQVGGYRVEVGKRRRLGVHSAGWSVRYREAREANAMVEGSSFGASADTGVQTEYEFLRWDDIVRDHWPRNPAVLAWDLIAATWLFTRSGALWTMFKLSWPPVVALVVPFLVLLGLLLALPLAGVVGRAITAASGSAWIGMPAGAALFAATCAAAVLAERRLKMQWLLRSYAFTGRQGTRGWPMLDARLDAFGERIAARASADGEPCDELLVVAHSSGSIMGTAALARALARDPQLARRGPRLAFLTLGQWSPALSSLPNADAFIGELDRLAREPDLDWVDIAAPPDGCCFALTDPVRAAGLPPGRANHPRLLSPRFATLFSKATYAVIKRDRFRLHFQYLMASELRGDYDYTAITAGPLTLGQRFAAQPSVDDFKQFRWSR